MAARVALVMRLRTELASVREWLATLGEAEQATALQMLQEAVVGVPNPDDRAAVTATVEQFEEELP